MSLFRTKMQSSEKMTKSKCIATTVRQNANAVGLAVYTEIRRKLPNICIVQFITNMILNGVL